VLRVVLRFTLAREAKVCLCCFVTGEFRLLQHSLQCSLSYGTIDQDYTIAITSSLSPVCLKVVTDRVTLREGGGNTFSQQHCCGVQLLYTHFVRFSHSVCLYHTIYTHCLYLLWICHS